MQLKTECGQTIYVEVLDATHCKACVLFDSDGYDFETNIDRAPIYHIAQMPDRFRKACGNAGLLCDGNRYFKTE